MLQHSLEACSEIIFSARHVMRLRFSMLYEYRSIMSWLSVWLWFPERQKTNGTLWRLQSLCVSLENTLWLLSYASCVICMHWIKYLSHLFSFAHLCICTNSTKRWNKWPLLLLPLIYLLKNPMELINKHSFICVDLFLMGSFLILYLIFFKIGNYKSFYSHEHDFLLVTRFQVV